MSHRAIRIRGRESSALVIRRKGNVGRNGEVERGRISKPAQVRRKCISSVASPRTSHSQPMHDARAEGKGFRVRLGGPHPPSRSPATAGPHTFTPTPVPWFNTACHLQIYAPGPCVATMRLRETPTTGRVINREARCKYKGRTSFPGTRPGFWVGGSRFV